MELARKKKQALDQLFNSGKISASTYESLDKELKGIISEVEARQKDLADKMTSKIGNLEDQISTLEIFLANSEIQYAAGEIDDDLHANGSSAFSLGLDSVKKQLTAIREVVTSIMPEVVAPTPPSTTTETEEAPTTGDVVEEAAEISLETPVEEAAEVTIETPVEEAAEVTIETPVEEAAEISLET
ncbi:MAG: CdvA-like protein, partial [Candidatus Bathyarchaeota archaeon]